MTTVLEILLYSIMTLFIGWYVVTVVSLSVNTVTQSRTIGYSNNYALLIGLALIPSCIFFIFAKVISFLIIHVALFLKKLGLLLVGTSDQEYIEKYVSLFQYETEGDIKQ